MSLVNKIFVVAIIIIIIVATITIAVTARESFYAFDNSTPLIGSSLNYNQKYYSNSDIGFTLQYLHDSAILTINKLNTEPKTERVQGLDEYSLASSNPVLFQQLSQVAVIDRQMIVNSTSQGLTTSREMIIPHELAVQILQDIQFTKLDSKSIIQIASTSQFDIYSANIQLNKNIYNITLALLKK